MSFNTLALPPDQLRFLAALRACGEPAPLDLVQIMAAISTAALDAVLTRGRDAGWLSWSNENLLTLTHDLPDPVRHELKRLNSRENLTGFIRRLRVGNPENDVSKRVLIKLLADTDRVGEAAETELDLAHAYIKRHQLDQAYRHHLQAVEKLYWCITNGEGGKDRDFVNAVIELSNLSFAVGRGMRLLQTYVRLAVNLAEQYGNIRAYALACLHLGRLLLYLNQADEGMAMLAAGKEKVELLGDADILKASAEFLGLYFRMRGRCNEALVHLERTEQLLKREEDRVLVFPMILWVLGITLLASGQVPRALGFFNSYWRSSKDMNLPAVASIAKAHLGFSLAMARKKREALYYLRASLEEAGEGKFEYSQFVARVGLTIQYFHDGDLNGSYETLQTALRAGGKASFYVSSFSIYLLDVLGSFHQKGYEPVYQGWKYQEVLDSLLKEESDIGRGIALRRRAEDNLYSGLEASLVMRDLMTSVSLLERAGADLFLNDTQIALVRLYLREDDYSKARETALKVWQRTREMGLSPESLPEDVLKVLPKGPSRLLNKEELLRNMIKRYLKLLHDLDVAMEEDELFHGLVRRLGGLINAERGVLFWTRGAERPGELGLRAVYNFTEKEMQADAFKPSLKVIRKSILENQYIRIRPHPDQYLLPQDNIRELLCLPVQADSEARGVLYFDDSYASANFDLIPAQWASIMIDHTNIFIGLILKNQKLQETTSRLAANRSLQLEHIGRGPILTQAPAMLNLLGQAERAARSEATLLITGETGTGKELMVSRLHKLSSRASGPFMVVDATTIPESLVESELFGHEKGAFTGADDQKTGRIELAHQGTLFIDEIGELPLQVQVKLLRTLETKTFYRVGGTQAVKSDFRLVAATNRSLADEVTAGRFRQDLYYRLNVIQLFLPPLRERGDDILLLTRHFLQHYGEKYGRSGLKIDPVDMDRLMAYPWPGNIRQLKNVIERAVVLSEGDDLILDLPKGGFSEEKLYLGTPTMNEFQRRYILHTLDKTGGRIAGPNGAAEILGMKRSTLYKRMYKLGIKKISS